MNPGFEQAKQSPVTAYPGLQWKELTECGIDSFPGSPQSPLHFLRESSGHCSEDFFALFREFQRRPVYEKSSVFSWASYKGENDKKSLFFNRNVNPERQKTGQNPEEPKGYRFGLFFDFFKTVPFYGITRHFPRE